MTIPKLSNINNYYNKVKQLISVNDEKREKLKTDISSYEKAIQNINSENLLDTVNGQIELLTKKFDEHSLIYLSLGSTQEDIKRLKDIIANRAFSDKREFELIQLLEHVDIAKLGNDSIIGIKTYFSIQHINKQALKRLLEIQQFLEKFESLEKTGVEIDNIKKLLQNQIDEKNRVTKVISDFQEYERILKLGNENIIIIYQNETICDDVNKE
jgi:hypothetical protein